MDPNQPHLPAIAANLRALRAILFDALHDIDQGLDAAEEADQNAAVGSIIQAGDVLTQAGTLIHAIRFLHRQS